MEWWKDGIFTLLARGRADLKDNSGKDYVVYGSLPPSKLLCSNCWMAGHWKADCRANGLAYEMYEPALVVLKVPICETPDCLIRVLNSEFMPRTRPKESVRCSFKQDYVRDWKSYFESTGKRVCWYSRALFTSKQSCALVDKVDPQHPSLGTDEMLNPKS